MAPAVIFYNVYECGSTDEDTASETVDTSAAGANVLIADGTINNVTGSYVARIYDPDSVVLSEDGMTVEDSGKLHKYDGAFYSKMSMNVDGGEAGTGVLNITAD
ncbi:Nitroreductase domain-containing protein, partial [Dysosmobacter welbionis]